MNSKCEGISELEMDHESRTREFGIDCYNATLKVVADVWNGIICV